MRSPASPAQPGGSLVPERRGLSLRVRVSILLAGLTAVLVVVGAVSSVAVARSRNIDNNLQDRLHPASAMARDLYIQYLNQLAAVRGYDIDSNPAFLSIFTMAADTA